MLKLVETPTGKRPLRTVVDALAGDGPRAINSLTDQIQAGMFGAMGMGGLLQPQGSGEAS